MTEKAQERFGVTADDIRRYNWQDRIAKKFAGDWLTSRYGFVTAAKECKDAGDDLGFRVYSLLHTVASFHPNYDSRGNPYGPLWTDVTGKRSLMAEDLTDSDLDALAGIVHEIADPDFRARLADILWECKRDHKTAEVAVRAFIESANNVKTDDLWPLYTERLERAAQLAAKLGFGKPLHQEVLRVVEAAISEFENNQKSGLLCKSLMHVALAHDATDTKRYAALSERLAKDFADAGNWDFSEMYWQLAEQWHRRRKDEAAVGRCQLAAAECFISKAEQGLANKKLGSSYAAHWMGVGVQALRQARADAAHIQEVHRRFLELQQKALGELNPMEFDVEAIPGFREAEEKTREAAIAHVSGYTFEEAVGRLAHITKPTDSDALRKQLEKESAEFIWDKIAGTEALDHAGKVADTIPPVGLGPADVEEEAMRKKMVLRANEINWQMQVAWKIEPARIAIMQKHGVRRRDLFFLVAHNPFIAPGHEGIYLRGLQAGFFGDWLVAMHLLIPQVEASVRHVLQQHNVVTSTLESDQTQKERDLNQLLWMPEFEEIFGANIAFDLRGILIERFGGNIRNESAHGLMPEAAFYQPTDVYLWWLILHLCWIGHAHLPDASGAPASDQSQPNPTPTEADQN